MGFIYYGILTLVIGASLILAASALGWALHLKVAKDIEH